MICHPKIELQERERERERERFVKNKIRKKE